MKSPSMTLLALSGVLFCLGFSGCVTRHLSHPYEVHVRDAETGQPIPGATVGLRPRPSLDVDPITAVADAQGTAVVRIPRSKLVKYETPVWSVSAPGYLACEERSKSDFERTASRQIKLHRGPARLVVTVPTGYRGPILIDKRPREKWLQLQNGQREFAYLAERNGYVSVDASPLMLKWLNGEAETRLVDEQGDQLSASSVRRVWKSPEREILVVGSEQDAGAIRQVVFQETRAGKKTSEDPAKINALFQKYREESGVD